MLTAFEPEACGHLVEGMQFHRFYFEMERSSQTMQTTMAQPTVRILGNDVAVVCYNRINQSVQPDGAPTSQSFEETRVWHRQDGQWKHVHFPSIRIVVEIREGEAPAEPTFLRH